MRTQTFHQDHVIVDAPWIIYWTVFAAVVSPESKGNMWVLSRKQTPSSCFLYVTILPYYHIMAVHGSNYMLLHT